MITQISIHAPPRGATSAHPAEFAFPPFQFTPLREGRPAGAKFLRQPTFQFTPLREGRLGRCHRVFPAGYFNSRPSARGDLCRDENERRKYISIHAPPRGATLTPPPPPHWMHYFNSRPSARGDARSPGRRCKVSAYFNSRPSARGDAEIISPAAPAPFQFTPLREGRHHPPRSYPALPHFNSRPSARGDPNAGFIDAEQDAISIHAPPRGATRYCPKSCTSCRFQFTPLREGRHAFLFRIRIDHCISIHAPPRGATMTQATLYIGLNISIHAPPRGAT